MEWKVICTDADTREVIEEQRVTGADFVDGFVKCRTISTQMFHQHQTNHREVHVDWSPVNQQEEKP